MRTIRFRPLILCYPILLVAFAFAGRLYSQDANPQGASPPPTERKPRAGAPVARPGLRALQSISGETTQADVLRILEQDDTNQDGKLGEGDKTRPNLQRNFARFDINSDGFLDAAEIKKTGLRPYGGDVFLEAFDKDGDGFLTKDEVIYRPLLDQFESFDANKDGKLAKLEMDSFRGGMLFNARGAVTPRRRLFESLNRRVDANGDGKVSKDEAINTPLLAKNFKALDANQDGFLTLSEIERLPQIVGALASRNFQRMDQDGDGKLRKDEATGVFRSDFDELDKDKSGFLTEAEFAKSPRILSMMRGRPMPLYFVPADQDQDEKLSREEAQHPTLLANFEEFDANVDGFLSKSEHRKLMDFTAEKRAWDAARAMLERGDANGDGKLQEDEFSRLPLKSHKFSDANRDKNGALTIEEFGEFLLALGNLDQASEKTFLRLDKDGNGAIAEDESPGMWQQIASYDTNQDGVIAKDEFHLGEGKRRYHSNVRRSGQKLLGVTISKAEKGLTIERVTPGSPAHDAKIKSGDVLLRIGEAQVGSLDDVRKLVNDADAQTLTLTLIQSGKETKVTVRFPAD